MANLPADVERSSRALNPNARRLSMPIELEIEIPGAAGER